MNELRNITSAEEYFQELQKCKGQYLICIAVRDNVDGMQPEMERLVKEFGLTEIRSVGWCSYVFVSAQGTVMLNEAGVDHHPLMAQLEVNGVRILMVSKSWRAGNKVSICLDEYEMAVQGTGLNIVVFDSGNHMLVDSVCFSVDRSKGGLCQCSRLRDFPDIPFPMRKMHENEADGFDIDLELNKIVEKFHLDEQYPQYKNQEKAKQAIRELADTWGEKESIACVTIGEYRIKAKYDELHFLENLTTEQKVQVDFFYFELNTSMGTDLYNLDANCRAGNFKQFENIKWDTFTRIYIISNHGDNYLGYWFRKQGIEYVNLYDYLELYGINNVGIDMEYYNFIADKRDNHFVEMDREMSPLYWAIYEEQQRYEMYSSSAYRLVIAKKLFFLAIVLRDFHFAEIWMKKILENGGSAEYYKDVWNEIQLLLYTLKCKLKERQQKDIIALWVDQVEYSLINENMPFISSLKEKGIWFDNYFTLTGFTRESVRTLFTGKKLIDDNTTEIQNLNFRNSRLLQELMGNDYRILIHGGYFGGLLPNFTEEFFMHYCEGPKMLWGTLRQILKTNSPCFVLNHILSEPHEPSLSVGIMDEHMPSWWRRKIISLRETDHQLEFYLEMLGKEATSIIFSDHGYNVFWPRQHVFLTIYGEKYNPRKITGLCSSIDFETIVKQVLEEQDIREEEICHDVVEFQGTTILRGGKFVSPAGTIREAVPSYNPPFRGYRGIITEKYVYIHFGGGREWLSRRNPMQPVLSWYKRPDDIYDANLLPEMRKLAGIDYGNEPPDYGNRSEFYLSLQEQIEKNFPYNEQKIILINLLIGRILESGIALHIGNQAAREFYLMLSLENRKKIIGVIDENPKCPCSGLNIPVFPLSAAAEKGVKNIIVTTRAEDGALQKYVSESEHGVHVYGLYGWFAMNGYYTKYNFWDFVVESMDMKPATKYAVPCFFHHASPKAHKIALVLLTQNDEATICSCLYRMLGDISQPLRIYCLDLNSQDRTAELISGYGKIDSSVSIEVLGQEAPHMALNRILDSIEEKYVMFLSPKARLHPAAISYLSSVAEYVQSDVASSWAAPEDSEAGKALLKQMETGACDLALKAELLDAAPQKRYEEWLSQDVSSFHGLQLYRVDFLRSRGIRFLADDREGLDSLFLQAVLLAPKHIKTESCICVYGKNEGGRKAEKEALAQRYEANRRALNRYRLWHHALPLLPEFKEQPILAVPLGGNVYYYIDKSKNIIVGTFIIPYTDKVQHSFFRDLTRPLLVKEELNLCHWAYLYQNVRDSEDFGEDNHVYLYYKTLEEFLVLLQARDITPYLEKEKLVFLFGDRDLAENYPLNFGSMYHISYGGRKKSCLGDSGRLDPADCWDKVKSSDFEDWLFTNHREILASKDFRLEDLAVLYGLYVDGQYGAQSSGGIADAEAGTE